MAEVEAHIQADAERHVDRSNQAEVREWLEALISDLECELGPPSYSFYEVERLRTVVGNSRILLALSQAALRDAPVGSSAVHLAHLERECRNAAERLLESEHELERVQLYTLPCANGMCIVYIYSSPPPTGVGKPPRIKEARFQPEA